MPRCNARDYREPIRGRDGIERERGSAEKGVIKS